MIQKENGASHTAIVGGCEGEDIYTIEGNRVVLLWRNVVGSDQGTNIPNN